MSKDAFMITSHGISQSERWLDTLASEYVQIDSRETPDLLRFAAELASQFNYYNTDNKPDGTWEDLFIRDPYLLILLASRINIQGNINTFNQYLNAVTYATNSEKQMENLQKLFSFLSGMANRLSLFRQQFLEVDEQKLVKEILLRLQNAEDEIQGLRRFYIEAVKEFGHVFKYGIQIPVISSQKTYSNTERLFFTGDTARNRILNSLSGLVDIFNRLNAKLNHLGEDAQHYVAKHKITEQQFSPQTGLFVAFLELYGHLRKKINGINRRHLDFYFKNLLAIQFLEGCPDHVLLIVEPNQGVRNFQVSTTDYLLAQIPGKEEPVAYRLESDLVVTPTKIAEVKTMLMSRTAQVVSTQPQFYDVIEKQVYQASHKVFVPSAYEKDPSAFVSWPAMGEDQHELAGTMRTMDDADLGLIIGSPLFYLPEGERHINLKIHFTTESFHSLIEFVRNLTMLTSGKTATSIHQLLSSAFVFTYTSGKSWEKIKTSSVRCDLENAKDKVLEIILRLNGTEPAFDVYNKEVHQLSLDSALPLLRIGLNNNAELHPFSFFSDTLIDRITINTDVKGFNSVKLQNNIGALSTANPFQAFGPQPAPGAFLDIKNTNLFNCYTKDFSIHLEWMNLPRNKGGFTSYYKGYGAAFANQSFLVGLSALNGGSYSPEPERQQKKQLFTLQKKDNYLENRTSISDIDFHKIEFLNRPTLATESNSDMVFREGALRMELISPPEAFGHQLFSQIFPEAVLRNAKKFGKKEPLPNQPIIPVMKSISVDYTLEYSENFNEGGSAANSCIELFHCYPFGYERIYPENEKKNIFFMPRFEDECNLLIGLKDAVPGSELSLLFRVEDNCFYHTLHDPETVRWTYMENNSWITFKNRELFSDSTNNFINSGIVKLNLPKELPTGNTILNPKLFWIRASLTLDNGMRPYITGICTNGVTAIRMVSPASENELDLHLPPGTLKNFAVDINGVQKVWQLFPSFHGKLPEAPDKYYVRVSERLRHKQRPVQILDIIQVVLEEFPQVLMVKCFNTSTENFMVVPGINLQLVLIPKEKKNAEFLHEQPHVSLATLFKVKTFLSGIISPFVNIEVGNPVYEKVKIICKVLLIPKASANSGFYLRQLTADINRYIAPWLFGEKEDVKIGNHIYKSDILLFIKTRPYVDHVSAFSVIHFFKTRDILTNEPDAEIIDTAIDEVEYIAGSSPASVLIPSSNHIIALLDKPVFEEPKPSGIGDFIIGEELLVSDASKKKVRTGKSKPEENDDEERFDLIITHNI